jgi:acetyltransferase-like isoleucine patch superfamily enzyme
MLTYKVYPNVQLGDGYTVGEFCIIGEPPRNRQPGELLTLIGAGATFRSHTVIYAGNHIGRHFQTGHGALVREENEIGEDVSIGSHSVIEHHVKIGNGVRIHSQVFVPEFSELEDGCWLGPNVVVTNALHPLCPKVKECLKGATVRRGAKVGAGVVLLPGVTIGEMALIGAGAVVVGDVPARAVMVGNPARRIKDIDDLDCPYGLEERPYS